MSEVRRSAVVLCQFGLAVAFVALWELASRLSWVNPRTLPPFTDVVVTLGQLVRKGSVLSELGFTVTEVGVAFLLSLPTGLILGFLVGENERAKQVLMPALQLIMAIPKAIFLPIFIFAFGIGFSQKVAFAFMLTVFVLILVGIAAVKAVPRGLITMSRSLGATRGQIYRRIYLPAMAPLIVEGVRLSFVFCIFGVLLAEMYGSQQGIGRLTQSYAEQYRMGEFLACVVVIVSITVLLNESLRWLENRLSIARESYNE